MATSSPKPRSNSRLTLDCTGGRLDIHSPHITALSVPAYRLVNDPMILIRIPLALRPKCKQYCIVIRIQSKLKGTVSFGSAFFTMCRQFYEV